MVYSKDMHADRRHGSHPSSVFSPVQRAAELAVRLLQQLGLPAAQWLHARGLVTALVEPFWMFVKAKQLIPAAVHPFQSACHALAALFAMLPAAGRERNVWIADDKFNWADVSAQCRQVRPAGTCAFFALES